MYYVSIISQKDNRINKERESVHFFQGLFLTSNYELNYFSVCKQKGYLIYILYIL